MKKQRNLLGLILAITVISAVIDLPKNYRINFQIGKFKIDRVVSGPDFDFKIGPINIKKELNLKQGLDLQGGTQLTLKADMKDIQSKDRDNALESARNVIDRRVNYFGVTEPVIQSSKVNNDYRIIVELPGIKDINQAIDLIGKTAELRFYELEASPSAESTTSASASFSKDTGLSGKDLKKSQVQFDSNTGKPDVGMEFTPSGAKLFEEITTRNVGKPVAIILDNEIISAPRVNQIISGGSAVITGDFTLQEAKSLSIQLNAGALPVPVSIIEQRNIGATLGAESIQKSVQAGLIGLVFVLVFMVANYGWLGLIADLSLVVYALLTLALYKLIPVTLTLPGIAGFILSVGMAVDSNILIFERLKEELRLDKPMDFALEQAFGRAWDSIRDANVTTLITCFILFNPLNWDFLNSSGMVRGFALTLALGIFISLFTGIIVTRNLIRTFYKPKKTK